MKIFKKIFEFIKKTFKEANQYSKERFHMNIFEFWYIVFMVCYIIGLFIKGAIFKKEIRWW